MAAPKLSSEEQRAKKIAEGPQYGDGWHIEWATSAFDPNFRFQYIVLEDDGSLQRSIDYRAPHVAEVCYPSFWSAREL